MAVLPFSPTARRGAMACASPRPNTPLTTRLPPLLSPVPLAPPAPEGPRPALRTAVRAGGDGGGACPLRLARAVGRGGGGGAARAPCTRPDLGQGQEPQALPPAGPAGDRPYGAATGPTPTPAARASRIVIFSPCSYALALGAGFVRGGVYRHDPLADAGQQPHQPAGRTHLRQARPPSHALSPRASRATTSAAQLSS